MENEMADWKVCISVACLGESMVVVMVAARVEKKADQLVHNSDELLVVVMELQLVAE